MTRQAKLVTFVISLMTDITNGVAKPSERGSALFAPVRHGGIGVPRRRSMKTGRPVAIDRDHLTVENGVIDVERGRLFCVSR
jgi:hypothetical protein